MQIGFGKNVFNGNSSLNGPNVSDKRFDNITLSSKCNGVKLWNKDISTPTRLAK